MSKFLDKLNKIKDLLDDLENEYYEDIHEKEDEISDLNKEIENLQNQIENYEIIKVIEFKENNKYYSDMIYDLENNLKKINKKYKYIPLNDFDGMYECFSQIVDNSRDIYLVKREKQKQLF